MRFIEATCKICKKPATAQFDEDAVPEAVDKFLPMLTHNHCYDLYMKRTRSREMIERVCWEYYRQPAKQQKEIAEATRLALRKATRLYAEAIAETFKAPAVIWSEDFIELLMERPQHNARILREYRNEVRKSAYEQPHSSH